jgi:hypothetical protein
VKKTQCEKTADCVISTMKFWKRQTLEIEKRARRQMNRINRDSFRGTAIMLLDIIIMDTCHLHLSSLFPLLGIDLG